MFENKVMEIIQYLLKESVKSRQSDLSESGLMEELEAKGFNKKDIHAALELFEYKGSRNEKFSAKRIRTFHELEKNVIPAKLQGVLMRLQESGLITSAELETLIEDILLIGQLNSGDQMAWTVFNKFFLQKYGFSLYDDMGQITGDKKNNFH